MWWQYLMLIAGIIAWVNLLPKAVVWWLVNVEKVDLRGDDDEKSNS